MRNAKQSIRRTVAGLLAGAMLLGMTPLAAFAEGSSSASGDWQFKAFGHLHCSRSQHHRRWRGHQRQGHPQLLHHQR